MILAGKTIQLNFADGREVVVACTTSDELRFEQAEKISLLKAVGEDDGAVPLWVIAGIAHWRLLRSAEPDIPASRDDFVDLLDPNAPWEVLAEGKVEASAPAQPTGESPPSVSD